MNRFLAFWLVLTATGALAAGSASLVFFNHVDLTYPMFFVILTAPVVQALVLTLALGSPKRVTVGQALRATWQQPLATPVLVLDVLLLGTGWLVQSHHLLGLAGTASVQIVWIATKAAGAGFFLGMVAFRGHTSAQPQFPPVAMTWRDRVWLGGFAGALLAAGAQLRWPWVQHAYELLLPTVAAWPRIGNWLATYALLFVCLLVLALRAGRVLSRYVPVSGIHVDGAVALLFAVGLVVVLNFFSRPFLIEPWWSLTLTAGSLAATLLLLAGIMAAGSYRRPKVT